VAKQSGNGFGSDTTNLLSGTTTDWTQTTGHLYIFFVNLHRDVQTGEGKQINLYYPYDAVHACSSVCVSHYHTAQKLIL
jgi:hypothetical protein